MWFGEVPHVLDDDEWDQGLSDLLFEIRHSGCLTTSGFGREPGLVEDFRPVKAARRRRSCNKSARTVALPLAAVLAPKPPAQKQQKERENGALRAQMEREAARRREQEERAKQERIGLQWAIAQLGIISNAILSYRAAGDFYRAREMQRAAANVLRAYPQLYELQNEAMRLGVVTH